MAEVINYKLPASTIIGGINQPLKKGTTIVAPANFFGMVIQNGKILKVFDGSFVFDNKSLPSVKFPLLGAVKDVMFLFFPYGLKGRVNLNKETFKLKNGKTGYVSLTFDYEISLENPVNTFNIPKLANAEMNPDGSMISPSQFSKVITKKVLDYFKDLADNNKTWQYSFGKDSRNDVVLVNQVRVCFKNVFESLGYKVESKNVSIEGTGIL